MLFSRIIPILIVLQASFVSAAGRTSLIERIEADLIEDKAISKARRAEYLEEFRNQLGAYAFDVLKGLRHAGADVLMAIVVEGSFEETDVKRTVAVASAAYVAIRRGAPADAVEGIAHYGFSKKLATDKIEAWANGYRDMTRFDVPADIAEELVYNAAQSGWNLDTFRTMKWGLVQAAKAGFDMQAFAVYLLGYYNKGGTRPGAMVSKAMRAFRKAAWAGKLPALPTHESPILEPRKTRPDPPRPEPRVPDEGTPPGEHPERARILSSLEKSIRSFLGTPYVWGGRTRRGTDCSGFVQTVFAEAGVELPRSSRKMWQKGQKVARGNLARGDLVFFRTRPDKISHVGIVTDPERSLFAHASSSRGVVISNLESKYYRLRFAGARRVIGL